MYEKRVLATPEKGKRSSKVEQIRKKKGRVVGSVATQATAAKT